MKSKTFLATLLLVTFALSFANSAFAKTTVSPGVVAGDVFEYSYKVTWSSTDGSLPVPSDIVQLNQIQGFQIKITSVIGTTVNAEVTKTFKNGSTTTETGFVDVESGSIRLPYGFLIVPSNLNVNEKIYSSGDAIINRTVTRSYTTGDRQTNERIVENTAENHYDKTDVYYDKIKGIGVSSFYESIDTYGSETENYTETITNTNSDVWAVAQASNSLASPTPTVPEFPLLAVPLLFAAVSAVLLVGKNVKKLPLKL
ncbi:MAG: hypothetical protein ACQCN5_10625 [Candidatus Bathyarchaeia archaeon]|jgi:hypothetical protein